MASSGTAGRVSSSGLAWTFGRRSAAGWGGTGPSTWRLCGQRVTTCEPPKFKLRRRVPPVAAAPPPVAEVRGRSAAWLQEEMDAMRLVLRLWRFGLRLAIIGVPAALLVGCQTGAGPEPQTTSSQAQMVVRGIALAAYKPRDGRPGDLEVCPKNDQGVCVHLAIRLGQDCLVSPRPYPDAPLTYAVSVVSPEGSQGEIVVDLGQSPVMMVSRLQQPLPSATALRPGDPSQHLGEAVVVGTYNALAHHLTVRTAVVSRIGLLDGVELLELDMAPRPGDVGGSVFSNRGELLGMIVAWPFDRPAADSRYAVSVDAIRAATSGEDPICRWSAVGE